MAGNTVIQVPTDLTDEVLVTRFFNMAMEQLTANTDRIKSITDSMSVISKLNQTISNPPTQTEVQAISDKVDELLNSFN